jgi:hypothetical protein
LNGIGKRVALHVVIDAIADMGIVIGGHKPGLKRKGSNEP